MRDTVVVTGDETDVASRGPCWVRSTGVYQVVLVKGGLCSSSDEVHDAAICLDERRCGQRA